MAPSLVGACAGACAGGLYDAFGGGPGIDGPLPIAAATGFFGLLAIPLLLAASAGVRAVYTAWQPEKLAVDLVEEGGGAPRLAAWVAVVWLGVAGIVSAVYQGTWLLASWTAFKPLAISFVEPVIAALAALLVAALSRPSARLLAHLFRKLDAWWRKRGHGTLLPPRAIFAVAALLGLLVVALIWFLFMKPKLGPLDTSALHAPALALAVTWLVHALWPRIGRARRPAGYALGVLAAATVLAALFALLFRPSLTLEIWGDRPLAGFAIDHLFDLDSIRSDVALDEFRPVDAPGAAHPDIVLVTIDTVRADHTPPYAGSAPMPYLKTMAERGTTFDWAFSPSNVTRRSIPSMVIGLDANRIRGRVVGWALRVDPRHILLAERMRAGGYETAGFMCCEGFWGPEARTGLARGLEHVEIEKNGHRLAAMARTWLDEREKRGGPKKPLFLWMHILEPHDWSGIEIADEVERKRIYDRSLTASDAMLGHVVGAFAQRAPEQAPIVIVSADHGEALGEHGHPFHSTDLYNSQMRIPLVMVGPGIKRQQVTETVSLTDMVPTILELGGFQVPAEATLDGRSIRDLATGARASLPDQGVAFAAMIKDRSNAGGQSAIVKGKWKLIETETNVELYDVHADPDERMNQVNVQPTVVRELKLLLDARVAAGDVSPFH
jgi:sulfatase-like protein